MITSELATAWAAYLSGEIPAGWSVHQGGDDVTADRPCAIVRVDSAEEHELLRGHYTVMMNLRLESIPADTTLTDFELAAAACECIGADLAVAQTVGAGVARIMDVRSTPGVIETREDLRVADYTVELEVQELQ